MWWYINKYDITMMIVYDWMDDSIMIWYYDMIWIMNISINK